MEIFLYQASVKRKNLFRYSLLLFQVGENSSFGYRRVVFNEELRFIPKKPVKDGNARIILGNLPVFEMELTSPM